MGLSNYNADNAIWAERLADTIAQLNDTDLTQPLEAGWTVSSVLAHLVFWDMRIVALLEKWNRDGAIGPSEIDADLINEVTRQLFLLLPARAIAEMCLTWSQKANLAIAALDERTAAEITAKAPNVRLDRTHHRQAHIEEIEAALGL
jgi:hypothetical protein